MVKTSDYEDIRRTRRIIFLFEFKNEHKISLENYYQYNKNEKIELD